MQLQTKQIGSINYNESEVINFTSGLFGFEEYKKYLLIKTEDEDFFLWLNSVDKPELAFPVIPLKMIDDQYPEVGNSDIFGLVTLKKDPLKITVNMKAPIYIDQNNKSGIQKILDNDKFSLNFKLFVESKEAC
jgi:flagellar assembly factor FliW